MNMTKNTLLLTAMTVALFSQIYAESDHNTMRSHHASKNDVQTVVDQVTGSNFDPKTMSNATLAAYVNSSTIGNLTLGSLISATVNAYVNSSTIGNLTLGSLITAMQGYATIVAGAAITSASPISWAAPTQSSTPIVSVSTTTITFLNVGVYLVSGQFVYTAAADADTVSLAATGTSTKVPATPALLVSMAVAYATVATPTINFSQIVTTSAANQTLIITPTFTAGSSIANANFKLNILRIS